VHRRICDWYLPTVDKTTRILRIEVPLMAGSVSGGKGEGYKSLKVLFILHCSYFNQCLKLLFLIVIIKFNVNNLTILYYFIMHIMNQLFKCKW